MKDSLKQYQTLRQSLISEKAAIEARLRAITEALSGDHVPSHQQAKPRKGRKRATNKLTLKAAVIQVTKGKSLSKPEILAAIEKIGYHFATNNPMNSLNTVLYTGKQFKNVGGKFVARQS